MRQDHPEDEIEEGYSNHKNERSHKHKQLWDEASIRWQRLSQLTGEEHRGWVWVVDNRHAFQSGARGGRAADPGWGVILLPRKKGEWERGSWGIHVSARDAARIAELTSLPRLRTVSPESHPITRGRWVTGGPLDLLDRWQTQQEAREEGNAEGGQKRIGYFPTDLMPRNREKAGNTAPKAGKEGEGKGKGRSDKRRECRMESREGRGREGEGQ
ncbi:hypothetical protein BJ322DRAFT_1015926 [Thelephora terrestris]|uniref:Uncharacterized protein n=1 Tax=Thelephora terrestris TaxID=56493 RepID=A0A9P6HP76_9AGAM|nr:hypothetical protein BJ322DRAFT_1015926 [Thelephora terrestris]